MDNIVQEAIFEAIEELKAHLEEGKRITSEPSTLLYGMDAPLDSFDLVTLIVLVEQKVQDKTDRAISLATEKALSQKNSPFRSVSTLQEYVTTLLQQ